MQQLLVSWIATPIRLFAAICLHLVCNTATSQSSHRYLKVKVSRPCMPMATSVRPLLKLCRKQTSCLLMLFGSMLCRRAKASQRRLPPHLRQHLRPQLLQQLQRLRGPAALWAGQTVGPLPPARRQLLENQMRLVRQLQLRWLLMTPQQLPQQLLISRRRRYRYCLRVDAPAGACAMPRACCQNCHAFSICLWNDGAIWSSGVLREGRNRNRHDVSVQVHPLRLNSYDKIEDGSLHGCVGRCFVWDRAPACCSGSRDSLPLPFLK